MKIFRKILCCLFSFLISGGILYTDILYSFPSDITMYQNETHSALLGAGVSIGNIPDEICASSGSDKVLPLKVGTYQAKLTVGNIPVRTVRLNVTRPESVCASGELIGLRIHNRGLIVTNLAPVFSGGKEVSPAQSAGLLPGDVIVEINGNVPKESGQVPSLLTNNSTLTVRRNNSIKKVMVSPVTDDSDGKLKLGLWVRDSSAGVGTMTYLNKNTLTYGALGHGISDSDTGVMFDVAHGTIEKSSVVSIEKGKRGTPGQICGSFSGADEIAGTVTKNCEAGIFGDAFPSSALDFKEYPVGVMSQVKCGDATILSAVDGEIKEYSISILRSMPYGSATKGLAIEITDPRLLDKTGGIVQGMSGSPIIQNGKIIGAVTHVLVNDPTKGYGIFIENMLKED